MRTYSWKYEITVLSLPCVIPRPRWICACFMGKVQCCNFYSLGSVPVQFQQIFWCRVSQSNHSQSHQSAKLLWRALSSVGGLSSCTSSSVRIQPTLLLSVLCHQSPGDGKKSAQKCKTALWLKELSEWECTMKWLESPEKITRNAKLWNKVSSEIWHSKSFPSLLQRGLLFSINHCLYGTSARMPFSPLSLQSSPPHGQFLSYRWAENVTRKHSVV